MSEAEHPYLVVRVRVSPLDLVTVCGTREALRAYLREHGIDLAKPFRLKLEPGSGYALYEQYYQ